MIRLAPDLVFGGVIQQRRRQLFNIERAIADHDDARPQLNRGRVTQ